MSTQQPLISIIIAVFNRYEVIENCIASILSQVYPHVELIVIDGGSTDGTVSILKDYGDRITYWESRPDKGIYHAFNKGLEHSTGDWIYFLGSDDYLYAPSSLEKVASHLSKIDTTKYKVAYGKVALFSSTGMLLGEVNEPWARLKNKFLQGCYICHQGVFHHRELFKAYGGFDESFKISGDYDFLLRELKNNAPLFMSDVFVASMTVGDGLSSHPGNAINVIREYSKARANNKISHFAPILFNAYVKAYIRLAIRYMLGENLTLSIVHVFRQLTGRKKIY